MTLNLHAVHHLTNDSPSRVSSPRDRARHLEASMRGPNLLKSQRIHLTVFPISSSLAGNLSGHVSLGSQPVHGRMWSVVTRGNSSAANFSQMCHIEESVTFCLNMEDTVNVGAVLQSS
jgi:hypothetical protein